MIVMAVARYSWERNLLLCLADSGLAVICTLPPEMTHSSSPRRRYWPVLWAPIRLSIRRPKNRMCLRNNRTGAKVGPINLRVRYRPVRIGWCIKTDDLTEFRAAARLSHTFWGGAFNPIIPLGDKTIAKRLIENFQVDCLHCVSETSEGDQLLQEHRRLEWPHSY